MRDRSSRHSRPDPDRARAGIQLACAALVVVTLALTWFDGLLAGPIQGREVQVIRLEPLGRTSSSAVLEAGKATAGERGLLVLRSTTTQPMPAILGQCHERAQRDGAIALPVVAGATALSCRLPAFQRSWLQRFAGLVTTSTLALAAATLLLAGLGVIRLSSGGTYGAVSAAVLAVAARAADPSADSALVWTAVAIAGCAAIAIGSTRLRRRQETPAQVSAVTTKGETTARPTTSETGDGNVAARAAGANGATAGTGRQNERDRITLPPPPEMPDEVPERAGGLTPPTIGLPSRTARKSAIAAADHPTYPDTMLDWGRIGNLELRAASARGASHRIDGRPRQDAFAVGTAPGGGFVIAAVADGVGSSDASQLGAAAAVRHGVAAVGRRLEANRDLKSLDAQAVMAEVATAVIASAPPELNENGRDVRESVATTLVLAAAELHPSRERTAWCARTGDSDARLLTKEGWRPVFAAEERSAIASSATATLPLSADAVEARLIDWREGEALVILSDGLAKPLGSGQGAVGRFLARAWAEPPDPLEFAIQVQFRRRTFDDDRTAVVLWPHESTGRRRR